MRNLQAALVLEALLLLCLADAALMPLVPHDRFRSCIANAHGVNALRMDSPWERLRAPMPPRAQQSSEAAHWACLPLKGTGQTRQVHNVSCHHRSQGLDVSGTLEFSQAGGGSVVAHLLVPPYTTGTLSCGAVIRGHWEAFILDSLPPLEQAQAFASVHASGERLLSRAPGLTKHCDGLRRETSDSVGKLKKQHSKWTCITAQGQECGQNVSAVIVAGHRDEDVRSWAAGGSASAPSPIRLVEWTPSTQTSPPGAAGLIASTHAAVQLYRAMSNTLPILHWPEAGTATHHPAKHRDTLALHLSCARLGHWSTPLGLLGSVLQRVLKNLPHFRRVHAVYGEDSARCAGRESQLSMVQRMLKQHAGSVPWEIKPYQDWVQQAEGSLALVIDLQAGRYSFPALPLAAVALGARLVTSAIHPATARELLGQKGIKNASVIKISAWEEDSILDTIGQALLSTHSDSPEAAQAADPTALSDFILGVRCQLSQTPTDDRGHENDTRSRLRTELQAEASASARVQERLDQLRGWDVNAFRRANSSLSLSEAWEQVLRSGVDRLPSILAARAALSTNEDFDAALRSVENNAASDSATAATNLLPLSRVKLIHDAEQVEHLVRRQKLPVEALQHSRALRTAVQGLATDGQLRNRNVLAAPYIYKMTGGLTGHQLHTVPYGEPWLRIPALNRHLDFRAIEADYRRQRPGFTFFDSFLEPNAAAALLEYAEESTVYHETKGGYLGAYQQAGMLHPALDRLVLDLRLAFPALIGELPIVNVWSYKADQEVPPALSIHADAAQVNLNFWLTPDDANLDPHSGGLVVYRVTAPTAWSFSAMNDQDEQESMYAFVKQHNATEHNIPFRSNRCVLFNSTLFHESARHEFKRGYTNRRINFTLLFGRRETS